MQSSIPINLRHDMGSFKKYAASNTDIMGEEVVPINARLMAVELCPAMYTKVLKRLTPVKPVQKKYALFAFTISQAGLMCFQAMGVKISTAVAQR